MKIAWCRLTQPFPTNDRGAFPRTTLGDGGTGPEPYKDLLKVDDREIQRGGVSYTIETIHSFIDTHLDSDKYLIIGLDQFESFDRWRQAVEILSYFESRGHLSTWLGVSQKLWRSIPRACRLRSRPSTKRVRTSSRASAFNLCNWKMWRFRPPRFESAFALGEGITKLVPRSCCRLHQGQRALRIGRKKIGDFQEFTNFCSGFLDQRGSLNVMAFDLTELDFPAEYTVISSGRSTKQASSTAQALVKEVKARYGGVPAECGGPP